MSMKHQQQQQYDKKQNHHKITNSNIKHNITINSWQTVFQIISTRTLFQVFQKTFTPKILSTNFPKRGNTSSAARVQVQAFITLFRASTGEVQNGLSDSCCHVTF